MSADKTPKHPFQIRAMFNAPMQYYELALNIGGFRTKEEMERFAEHLRDFVTGDNGPGSGYRMTLKRRNT